MFSSSWWRLRRFVINNLLTATQISICNIHNQPVQPISRKMVFSIWSVGVQHDQGIQLTRVHILDGDLWRVMKEVPDVIQLVVFTALHISSIVVCQCEKLL